MKIQRLEEILKKGKSFLKNNKRVLKNITYGGLIASSVLFYGCEKDDLNPSDDNDLDSIPNTQQMVVLSGNALNNIKQYTNIDNVNATIGFFENTSELDSLSKGDILFVEPSDKTPQAVLGKIDYVQQESVGFCLTSIALDEVVENGELSKTIRLLPGDEKSQKLAPGVKFIKSYSKKDGKSFDFNYEFDEFVLYDQDGNQQSKDDQIVLNGFTSFNSSLDVGFKIKDKHLDYFLFKNTITQNSNLKVDAKISIKNLHEKETFMSKKFPTVLVGYIPTTFGIPIPVYVTPQLSLNTYFDGDIVIDAESNVTQSASLTAGVSYENNDFHDLGNFIPSFDFEKPKLSAELNAKVSSGPRLDLFIYDWVGPSAEADAFARLKADYSSFNLYYKLFGGLEAKIGARMHALGKDLIDYSATVIKDSTLLKEGVIGNEPPAEYKEIAFVSDRDGNYEIYTMNSDGSNQTRLTNNSNYDSQPNWSPSGNEIVFVSNRDGNKEIYKMNSDGSNQTRLTYNSETDEHPKYSPNGTEIVFRKSIDGTDFQDIYKMNSDGTNKTNISNNSEFQEDYPIWSTDGSKIFYCVIGGNILDFGIYKMNSDGSNQIPIFKPNVSDFRGLSFSSANSKLLFSNNAYTSPASYELYTINQDGSGFNQITNQGGFNYSPSWSLDATKIVYVSQAPSGCPKIYTINSNGSNKTQITFGNYYDTSPSWNPSDK